MYKYSHGLLPKVMNELYVKNSEVHRYNTRRSHLLHVPNGIHTRHFCYRSVLIWNELTIQGVEYNVSLTSYKLKLKFYLQYNDLNIGY